MLLPFVHGGPCFAAREIERFHGRRVRDHEGRELAHRRVGRRPDAAQAERQVGWVASLVAAWVASLVTARIATCLASVVATCDASVALACASV